MSMICVRRSLLAAGLALTLALTPAVLVAAGADAKEQATPAEKVKKQLDQNVSVEITDQTLTLALNQLREQTKINFVLDKLGIQQMGQDPDQMPVNVKLKDVKARTALRSILSPYNLGYAIIGDTILIGNDDMVMQRQMKQRVSLDLEKADLAAALKQLSKETATNLLLDTRAAKEGKTAVSLEMEDVPLDTAVRLLAEMAGLKPVRVGNVLLVTTKAHAAELRSDPELNPNGAVPNPGIYGNPGMPGFPGANVPVPPGGGIVPLGGPVNGPGGIGGGGPVVPETTVPSVEKPIDPEQSDPKPADKPAPKPDVIKKEKEG